MTTQNKHNKNKYQKNQKKEEGEISLFMRLLFIFLIKDKILKQVYATAFVNVHIVCTPHSRKYSWVYVCVWLLHTYVCICSLKFIPRFSFYWPNNFYFPCNHLQIHKYEEKRHARAWMILFLKPKIFMGLKKKTPPQHPLKDVFGHYRLWVKIFGAVVIFISKT